MSYSFTSPDKNYHNKESLDNCSEIKKKLNKIFEASNSILIVGWRKDSDSGFIKHCVDNGKKITIVEIFPKNIESIPPTVTAVCSDIREYEINQSYDMFLWQHGPEHVHKSNVYKFFNKYNNLFKHIVLEVPNGPNQQGALYGNPYEEHISTWEPNDFLELGFEYITYAGQTNDGFIIGYKINNTTEST